MNVTPRRQCAKCPWKTCTNPLDIPDGYDETKHRALTSTIAQPGAITGGGLRVMACHATRADAEKPCVGWMINQLGPGNNIALRLAVAQGRIDGNVRTVGTQHDRFEDTLPPLTGDAKLLDRERAAHQITALELCAARARIADLEIRLLDMTELAAQASRNAAAALERERTARAITGRSASELNAELGMEVNEHAIDPCGDIP